MTGSNLTVGSFRYDTTRALFDGDVQIEGVTTEMRTARTIPEIFRRLLRDQEFDVSELGMIFYLRTFSPESAYVALPVFPNRHFRHSCIYVNTNSGIEQPEDIVDKRIGEFGVYSQDSGVWAKGALMDEHGFRPERNRWLIGGLDQPMPPFDFVPQTHAGDVDVQPAPDGSSLGTMLDQGEIDVLFSANVPQAFLDGSPHIRRLFPDFETVERSYFRRTKLFPIMHTLVIRRALVAQDPGLPHRVYAAFLAAKDIAADEYRAMRRLYQGQSMQPWMDALVERNTAELPTDWWPYGIRANRMALEANLRYQYEQGLVDRHYAIDEVFETSLLDT